MATREILLKKKKKELYKLAERYFHRYIVLRDIKKRGHCITCKGAIEQAGHWQHGGNNRYAFWVDFDERNLNGQCKRCNHFMAGNLNIYTEELMKMYGTGIVAELNALSWKVGGWSEEDLVDIIEKYRNPSEMLT